MEEQTQQRTATVSSSGSSTRLRFVLGGGATEVALPT